MSHLSREIGGPSLDIAAVGINPIEPSLGVLVLPFYGTVVDLKENMAAIVAPAYGLFERFVVGNLSRRPIWRGDGEIERVNL